MFCMFPFLLPNLLMKVWIGLHIRGAKGPFSQSFPHKSDIPQIDLPSTKAESQTVVPSIKRIQIPRAHGLQITSFTLFPFHRYESLLELFPSSDSDLQHQSSNYFGQNRFSWYATFVCVCFKDATFLVFWSTYEMMNHFQVISLVSWSVWWRQELSSQFLSSISRKAQDRCRNSSKG